jgi:hypothetical protein
MRLDNEGKNENSTTKERIKFDNDEKNEN